MQHTWPTARPEDVDGNKEGDRVEGEKGKGGKGEGKEDEKDPIRNRAGVRCQRLQGR